MPSTEAFLTRELEIRFIDARKITNEAKVKLGIRGYPNKDQLRSLRNEAVRIFQSMPEDRQEAMRNMSSELEAIKVSSMSHHSAHSSTGYEDESSGSSNWGDKQGLVHTG